MRGKIGVALSAWLSLSAPCMHALAQQPPPQVNPEPYRTGSITEDIANDPRNKAGLSFGFHEGYADNILRYSIGGKSIWATSLSPGVFVNAGKGQTRFHADYDAACSIYGGMRELNTASHFGNLRFSFQRSQSTSFYLDNVISSGPNDFGLFGRSAPYSSIQQPTSWIELDYPRQRVTSNSLTGGANLRVTGKSHLDLFGTYHIYRWSRRSISGTDGVQARINFGYGFTSRLSLSGGYEYYADNVGGSFPGRAIHRLDLVAVTFGPAQSWQVFVSGGLGLTQYIDSFHHTWGARAGISRTSHSNVLAVSYARGFTSSIGLPGIYLSNIITAEFTQRLAPRLSLELRSHYSRNDAYLRTGFYGVLRGSATMELALRHDLIASANYSYWDQWRRDLAVPVLDTTRWAACGGLRFVWRSKRP